MKLKKGSKEAKAYMAKLRSMSGRRSNPCRHPENKVKVDPQNGSYRRCSACNAKVPWIRGKQARAKRPVCGSCGSETDVMRGGQCRYCGKKANPKRAGSSRYKDLFPKPCCSRPEHVPSGQGVRCLNCQSWRGYSSKKNPPRTRKGAENLLDKQIEAAYYRLCDRVQVSIMDIPKIFRDVKLELAGGTPMDAAILSVVKRYQVKGHGGRELPNPPAYFIIDSSTNKILAIVRGHPMKSYGESVTKGMQIARRLGRAVIHVVNPYVPKGFAVGTVVTPLFYSYKSNLIHPNGSMSSRNPAGRAARSNPSRVAVIADLVQLEARKIAGWLRREGIPATEDPVRNAWGVMVPKPLEAKAKVALGRVLTQNPAARCNPAVCRNPAHGHRPCKPNPLIQTVLLASGNPGKLRPKGAKIWCVLCGEWARKAGPYKRAPKGVGWSSGKLHCRDCYSGMMQLKAEGYKFKSNPLTRSEAAQILTQARYRLSLAKSRKYRGMRSTFAGEAVGMSGVVQSHGPASAREASLKMQRRGARVGIGINNPPVAKAWGKMTKRQRQELLELVGVDQDYSWLDAKLAWEKLDQKLRREISARWFDSSKKRDTGSRRRAVAIVNPAPKGAIEIPFRQGQIITVAQALAWARKTGNTSLVKQCEEAMKLCKRSNGTATKVRFDLVAMGDPKQIDTVMAGVEYGETDETVYKPTKGSKKGQHLYRHEWGEGSGKRKTVPLIATPGGKALVMPLRAGQKATDWLRG